MKLRFALAALLALCLTAAASIVYQFPSVVSFTGPVRLTDGHVLAAGPYDVKIHYQGFGNTAEIWFFTGGVFKGKTNAEARGFPSGPASALSGPGASKIVMDDESPKEMKLDKSSDAQVKLVPGDRSIVKLYPKVEGTDDKVDKKYVKMSPATSTESFSWGAHGFQNGLKGQAQPSGRGSVKLSFDSANSAAGFSALLPAVQK
jgi:hypothetical protein